MNKKIIKLGVAGIVGICAYKLIVKNRRTIKMKLAKYIDNEKLVNAYIKTNINTSVDKIGDFSKDMTNKMKDRVSINKTKTAFDIIKDKVKSFRK